MKIKNKLKICLAFICVVLITGSCFVTNASSASVISLQINNPVMSVDGVGAQIDPGRGTVPVIVGGRTLVPIRAIMEALGGSVGWNDKTSEVTLAYKNDFVKLVINSSNAYLNNVRSTLDVAPTIINERTMLPIRYIAESFKFNVDWDGATQVITITNSASTGGSSIRVVGIGTDQYIKKPILDLSDLGVEDEWLGDPDGALSDTPPQSAEEKAESAVDEETMLEDLEGSSSDGEESEETGE